MEPEKHITNEMILDAFLTRRGVTRTGGCDLTPLLPFFQMDAVYAIFRKSVATLELEEGSYAAERRERWKTAYNAFNRPFFDSLSEDYQNAVIDRMDRYDAYVANDLLMLQATIWRYLNRVEPGRTSEMQNVAADCLLAELLACSAEIHWERVEDEISHKFNVRTQRVELIRLPKEVRKIRTQIDDVRLRINAFTNVYYEPTVRIAAGEIGGFEDGIMQFTRKTMRFINEDANENYRNREA